MKLAKRPDYSAKTMGSCMRIPAILVFRNALKRDRIRIIQALIFVSTVLPAVCPKRVPMQSIRSDTSRTVNLPFAVKKENPGDRKILRA